MRNIHLLATIVSLFLISGSLTAMDTPAGLVLAADQNGGALNSPKELAIGESDALVARGNDAFSRGDKKSAIEFYNQAIERSFLNATAYFNRATAYVQLSEFELAIADFTQVMQFSPDFAPALHARAVAYRLSGNPKAAMTDHDLALGLTPSEPTYRYHRALTLGLLGRVGEAIADLSNAIELNPNFLSAYKARGKSYFVAGAFSRALRDYSKALQLDSSDMNVTYNHGLALAMLGQFEQAEESFSIVLRNKPYHLPTLISRSDIRVALGKKQEALLDIDRAIKIDPSSKKAQQMHSFLQADLKKTGRVAGGQ